MKCALTGNRPSFLPCGYDENHEWLLALKDRMREFIKSHKISLLISGMALGSDQWWAEVGIELGIPVHAYIPCPEQPDKWGWSSKKKYKEILDKCEKQITISGCYTSDCFKIRNYAMVDCADMLVCVLDPDKTDGGTVQTVAYGKTKKKPIFNIYDVIVELKEEKVEKQKAVVNNDGKIPF